MGLALAYGGGLMTGGQKGVADIPVFAGIGLMGGAMLRDFAIVATAFEVDAVEARKAGLLGVLSLASGRSCLYCRRRRSRWPSGIPMPSA